VTIISNKTIILSGASILSLSVLAGTLLSEPLFFFVPFLLLVMFCMVQYPQLLHYTLLLSIPWSVEATITETLATDLPDEPLMILMAFIVIAVLLTQKQMPKHWPFLVWVLLVSVAWSIITVAASTHVMLSIKFLLAKGWYLLAFAGAPLVLKGDKKLITYSALLLLGSMLLATLFSLYRHATLGFTFATINVAIAPFFRNHVNYSALLVFMVPLLLAFYNLQKAASRRALIFLSLLVVVIALYFSFSRGAWLAFFVGLLSYGLLKKRWLVKVFLASVFLITSITLGLAHNDQYLAFAPKHDVTVYHKNFTEHLIATYRGEDVSTAERLHRWVAGIRMSSERWLTGFGPTTFYQHYKSYTVPAFRTWVSDNPEHSTVHNYFLLLLIEQGYPGLFLFLLLLGAMFWSAQTIYHRTSDPFWKTTVATIGAILWMQCTLNFLSDLIETDKVGSVFLLCFSFLLIADAKTKQITEQADKE
jgi:O-antigen ligase